jgi:Exopolyphosphatase
MDALFIDIGSNTIKSLLAKFEGGKIVALSESTVAKRISADSSLATDAVQIIADAVGELKNRAAEFSKNFQTVCFGTSALRDFPDAVAALERLAEMGVDVRVLSGAEEASLSFNGALTDDSLNIRGDMRVVYADLGGGSMEFVEGCGHIAESARSLPLGAVRLTKMFSGNLEKIAEYCGEQLSSLKLPDEDFRLVIAGGAVSAARHILGNGIFCECSEISSHDMHKVLKIALAKGAAGLSEKYSIPPTRADILPAAFVCMIQTMKHFGQVEFTHATRSLRYGVAEKYFYSAY